MILIVDDDEEFLLDSEVSLAGLTSEGLLFANTRDRALGLLDLLQEDIALVLVDLNLQGDDGFSLISELRKLHSDLPIIAFSGVRSRDVLESAKLIGATEVLQKPITPEWRTVIKGLRGNSS